MKQFQFKTVRYEPGFGKQIMGDDFGDGFQKVLADIGKEGWDLKSVVREQGLLDNPAIPSSGNPKNGNELTTKYRHVG